MIEANRAEFEAFGPLAPRRGAQLRANGAEHEVEEYWLNEEQALLVSVLSKAPNAPAVRAILIRCFVAWRRGHLLPPPAIQEEVEGLVGQLGRGREVTSTGRTGAFPTMSSREIAELLGNQHDKVKQSIERLAAKEVFSLPPMGEVKIQRERRVEAAQVYLLDKRSSFIVVAQLSPEFTARVVDRWQELEAQVAAERPQLPDLNNPVVLQRLLLASTSREIERDPPPIVRRAQDGKVMADSRDVAAYFGKLHKDVLRAIDGLIAEAPDTERNFAPSFYKDPTGRELRCFDMDRDGFTLLAMGFTGPKALRFKLAFFSWPPAGSWA